MGGVVAPGPGNNRGSLGADLIPLGALTQVLIKMRWGVGWSGLITATWMNPFLG